MGKMEEVQRKLDECFEDITEIIKEMEENKYNTNKMVLAKQHIVKAIARMTETGHQFPDLR